MKGAFPLLIEKDVLLAEKADYEQQKATQQDIIQRAQTEIGRAQQIQQQAQAAFLMADGALQAVTALLKKMEAPDEAPAPAPSP